MTRPTVAVIGDNTIDRYVGPAGGDYVGGNAVNVAVQLAEHGFAVHYFGAVGPDQEGERIRDALSVRGVDIEGLVTYPGESALTVIRVDDFGDRHMEEEHFGVTAEYFPSEAAMARIADADWIQIGMLPRADELRRRLRAMSPTLRMGQDCSVSSGYRELAVAFVSGDVISAPSVASRALAGGAQLAVVTHGADGSTAYRAEGGSVHQGIVPVAVVDTTGAGDSFIAGFVAALLRSGALAAAMSEGASWAAQTCSHLGGFRQTGADPPRRGRSIASNTQQSSTE
ncbi:MAG: PfkB family carbohydrate kinase [Actinomycetia bacterium]|nr:PfkB family carbohydrate kinase [Actinomycetes bacterium]